MHRAEETRGSNLSVFRNGFRSRHFDFPPEAFAASSSSSAVSAHRGTADQDRKLSNRALYLRWAGTAEAAQLNEN